ncbi:MAG: response regulator [Gammaproteobacteria bacterium]
MPLTRVRSRITRPSGTLLCCLALVVLTGWVLGNPVLVRLAPGSVAMSINTALMFGVAGVCLLLHAAGRERQAPARALAAVLVVLPLAILTEHLFDIDLRIDLAHVHQALGDGHSKPGRTAPNACLGFLFAGMGLLLRETAGRRAVQAAGRLFALLTFVIGLTAFLGYVLGLDIMYRIASLNRMATFTALGMTTLGAGMWGVYAGVRTFFPSRVQDEAGRITRLAVGLLVVFALATGLTSFAVLRDSFEHAAAQAHASTAATAARGIEALLDQAAMTSTAVARHPALENLMGQARLAGPDGVAATAASAFARAGLAVRVHDGFGRELARTGTLSAGASGLRVPFGAGDDTIELFWDDGLVLRATHVWGDANHRFASAVTEQRLDALTALLDAYRRAHASTDLLLCAREGAGATCFPSRAHPHGASFPARDGAALPIAHALDGQPGAASTKDARGIAVLAGHAPVGRYGLGVVVKTDVSDLYLPLRDRLLVLVAALALFVAGGVTLLRRWVWPLISHIVTERERIGSILDNSNDAFIAIDAEGKVTDWNRQAEKTLGLPAEEAIGRDLAELIVPPAQRAGHTGGFARFAQSGAGRSINSRVEVTALHASGREIPVELSVAPMKLEDGYGASAFLRDLSERKAAEARAAEHARALEEARSALAQSQKLDAVGKLTGGVAHDFNNVLQVVRGSLELLREEQSHAWQVVRRVDSAMGAVQRGAKLAAQLLAFARKQPLQPKPTNLGRVLRSMDDMLRRALGDAVDIDIVISGGLWNTLVDPHQLEQVILNLAINARDAMDGNGQLTIEAGNAQLDDDYVRSEPGLHAGQFVQLAVSDTGCGMTPDIVEKAFEPFFSTKPEGVGTGLGLSMTYGFVKQSHGHIRIYSEPGHGTTIRIYLPRTHDAEQLQAEPAPLAVQGGSETVLVVEDDAAVQATVVDMLEGLGYRVFKADHAAAALALLETGVHVDLLFTDVVMPGELRSPELARRACELLPDLKVLFTSGYTQNAIVHGGRLDPGVHLLSKPYGREQLGNKIRSLLGAVPAPAPAQPDVAALPRIAFVEDNEDFRAIGAQLLSMLGYEVESFASAEAALDPLTQGRFDVLLTDVTLPGMSGVTLATHVHARRPEVRVVLATGLGEALRERPAFAHRILAKPFAIDQLRACLDGGTA